MIGLKSSADRKRYFPVWSGEQLYHVGVGRRCDTFLLHQDNQDSFLHGSYDSCEIEGSPPSYDRRPEAVLLVKVKGGCTHRLVVRQRTIDNYHPGSVLTPVSLLWWVRSELNRLK